MKIPAHRPEQTLPALAPRTNLKKDLVGRPPTAFIGPSAIIAAPERASNPPARILRGQPAFDQLDTFVK
jgi:hypothetical protein